MQRGGLSTSTVIYSQEEVTLSALGGNGEGFRIVYSPAGLQELYTYTIKAFNSAWKYRYPTFVLGDGYQAKMEGEVSLRPMSMREYIEPKPILLGEDRKKGITTNLRNCFDQEEEIYAVIEDYRKDFERDSKEIAESKAYKTSDAHTVVIAHGIVGTAAQVAVEEMRERNAKVGLWRPITLRPLDLKLLGAVARKAKEIVYVESAIGQVARLVNDELAYLNKTRSLPNGLPKIRTLYKPAIGITPQEITDFVMNAK
jgi:2-oxoglutarate ferredoxin oxidoreductase subunit alpha